MEDITYSLLVYSFLINLFFIVLIREMEDITYSLETFMEGIEPHGGVHPGLLEETCRDGVTEHANLDIF